MGLRGGSCGGSAAGELVAVPGVGSRAEADGSSANGAAL